MTGMIMVLAGDLNAQSAAKNFKSGEIFDHHVHLLSPALIKIWKGLGIPFSKPDADYSQLQAIAKRLGTDRMKLISMAYLYGSDEFGKFENEYDLVKAENDYLAETKSKYGKNIKIFCGIHPLKDYALKEAERCQKELKTDGIKMHFGSSQVYLTEPAHLEKVKPIFAYAAKNKLPVILHFDNFHRKFGAADVNILANSILKDLPPLELQIAHFGTSGGFNPRTKAVINAFGELFKTDKAIKKHKILFDISAVALDKDSEGVKKLTDEEFAELGVNVRKLGFKRVRFATDYPLYSADEYLKILKNRLRMSEAEIEQMLRNK